MVLTGGEDHGNSPDMSRRMAALIPGARAEIIPGLRHMGLVEDPEAFNSRLVPFLAAASRYESWAVIGGIRTTLATPRRSERRPLRHRCARRGIRNGSAADQRGLQRQLYSGLVRNR